MIVNILILKIKTYFKDGIENTKYNDQNITSKFKLVKFNIKLEYRTNSSSKFQNLLNRGGGLVINVFGWYFFLKNNKRGGEV